MFLFFDTETTGLSRTSDRIVQIAWAITDRNGRVSCEESHIVKPEGYVIPAGASNIHGITTEVAKRAGRPRHEVLTRFTKDSRTVHYAIAHNISFDLGMLRGDLERSGLKCALDAKHHLCTMKLSTSWCALPKFNGSGGFKWPKLEELHYRLFGEYFDNAHDALADVHATRRCFFELIARKIIVIPDEYRGANEQPPKAEMNSGGAGTFSGPQRSAKPKDILSTYFSTQPAPANPTPFRLTQRADLKCVHCSTSYTVTMNRYERWARCPDCRLMSDAGVFWN